MLVENIQRLRNIAVNIQYKVILKSKQSCFFVIANKSLFSFPIDVSVLKFARTLLFTVTLFINFTIAYGCKWRKLDAGCLYVSKYAVNELLSWLSHLVFSPKFIDMRPPLYFTLYFTL